MKALITGALLLLFTAGVMAQINVSILINPPYSPYYEDYLQYDNRVVIILTNTSASPYEVYFRGEASGDNGINIRTKASFRPSLPVFVPERGVVTLSGGDLTEYLNVDNVDLMGISAEELIYADGLPEGNYQFCLQVLDYETDEPLSEEAPLGCSNPFPIQHIDPSFLVSPLCGSEVNIIDPQNLLLSWSISPGALPGTEYLLQMVEVLDGQSPELAMDVLIEPPFFERRVQANSYVYGVADPPLEAGKQYAIRVQSIDPLGRKVYRNDGYSEICGFTYGVSVPTAFNLSMPAAFPPFTHCSCNRPPSGNLKTDYQATPGTEVVMGGHRLTFTEILVQPAAPEWKVSGSGTMTLPWVNNALARVKVTFTELQLNEADEVIGGSARALIADEASFLPKPNLPEVNTVPLNLSDATALDQFFASNRSQLLSQVEQAADGTGFVLPLGIDQQQSDHTVAITGMYWTPENATFDAAIALRLPGENPELIALSATGVCFDANDLCGEARLFLAEDLELPGGITLKKALNPAGSTPADAGTSVTFDQDGFKKLHVFGEYTFPDGTISSVANGQAARASLVAEASDWSDWVATIDLEPFRINGVEDFTFTPSQGSYDHSDLANPPDLPPWYPEATTDLLWRGFSFREVAIALPDFFSAGNGQGITLAARDLLIDANGVSVRAAATNLLSINEGSLGGWAFSIDELHLDFFKNSIQSAGFDGKLLLPIAAGDAASQLDYRCLIQPQDLTYQFVVEPKENLEIPMWLARMHLDETSTITVSGGGSEGFLASADLNGRIDLRVEAGELPRIDFTAVTFQGLHLRSRPDYLSVDKFHAGLSSPQKSVAGLPVSLEKIGLRKLSGNDYSLDFDLAFRLGDLLPVSVTATTSLGLVSHLELSPQGQQWDFKEVIVNDIGVAGSLGPVDIAGNVAFFRNHPRLGDGIGGELKATFIDLFQVDAMALFGKKDKGYWAVDATAKFHPAPLQLSTTPFAIFGFGGGAYYNLSRSVLPPSNTALWNGERQNAFDVYRYEENNLGLKANVIMGLSDGSSLSMNGSLGVELDARNMTVRRASIEADVYALSPLMQTNKAIVTGRGAIELDFVHQELKANFGLDLNVANVITGGGDMALWADLDQGGWYFKLGDPFGERMYSRFRLLGDLRSEGYFNMGSNLRADLPPIEGIPGYNPSVLGQGSVQRGLGIAFGQRMSVSTDLTFLIFYMKLEAGIGFDVVLNKLSGTSCVGYPNPGLNGWFAKGQAYAYGNFDFGLDVDVWFYEGRISVGSAHLAAVFKAEVANPNYVEGYASAGFSVLGGLIEGSMRFHVQMGEKCKQELINPFAGQAIIEELAPTGDAVDITTSPIALFNYPVEKDLSIRDEQGKKYAFRIALDRYDLYKVENGRETKIKDIHSGDVRWTHNRRSATLYFNEELTPFTQYRLKVSVSGLKKDGDRFVPIIHKGKKVTEEKVVEFSTGGCPENLNGSGYVKYSYPLDRQRYFLAGESNRGFIHLKKPLSCLTEDDDFQYLASFQPLDRSQPIREMPFSKQGKKINFSIPPLEQKTIYRLILLKRPKRGRNPKGPDAPETRSRQGDNHSPLSTYRQTIFRQGSNQLAFQKLRLEEVQLKPGDVEMLTIHFQTSRFNNLREKLANSSPQPTKVTKNYFGNYLATYSIAESFDVFDTHGKLIDEDDNGEADYYVRPLVRIWEKRAANRWYGSHLQPFFNRAHQAIRPLPARAPEDIARYGYFPPTRPVKLSMGQQAAPLSDGELFRPEPGLYVPPGAVRTDRSRTFNFK